MGPAGSMLGGAGCTVFRKLFNIHISQVLIRNIKMTNDRASTLRDLITKAIKAVSEKNCEIEQTNSCNL
jgi:hypothetical protein